jgi:hypothetical protein
MRQIRWLELLKDYVFVLSYNPGNTDVVADVLSRKSLHMSALMVKELDLVEQFQDLSLVSVLTPSGVKFRMLKLTSNILEEIKDGQKVAMELVDCWVLINQGKEKNFRIDENEIMRFPNHVCVPDVPELKRKILNEGHHSSLSIHPVTMKMYQDLKKLFWWPRMKKDVDEVVFACLVCQKSKVEHQMPSGVMQPLFVLECKWDNISMDFVGSIAEDCEG